MEVKVLDFRYGFVDVCILSLVFITMFHSFYLGGDTIAFVVFLVSKRQSKFLF